MTTINLDKYRDLFLDEAREHVEALARSLAAGPPFARPAIDELFRNAHSIKAMAATMRLDTVAALAHAIESTLEAARAGVTPIDETLRDALLAASDRLVDQLAAFAGGQSPATATAELERLQARPDPTDHDEPGRSLEPTAVLEPEPIVESAPASEATNDRPATEPEAAPAEPARRFLRVDIAIADRLHERITELTHGVATLEEKLAGAGGDAKAVVEDLRRCAAALRADSLSMRLVRIDRLEPKLGRAARDAAERLGKKVEFSLAGGDVALDRGVVESLADPLIHLVRNAVDHGLESPVERERSGKTRSTSASRTTVAASIATACSSARARPGSWWPKGATSIRFTSWRRCPASRPRDA